MIQILEKIRLKHMDIKNSRVVLKNDNYTVF